MIETSKLENFLDYLINRTKSGKLKWDKILAAENSFFTHVFNSRIDIEINNSGMVEIALGGFILSCMMSESYVFGFEEKMLELSYLVSGKKYRSHNELIRLFEKQYKLMIIDKIVG